MQFGLKLIISAIAVALLVVVLVWVARVDKGTAQAALWRGGGDDLFRKLLADRDGKLKSFVKPCLILLFGFFIAVIWVAG